MSDVLKSVICNCCETSFDSTGERLYFEWSLKNWSFISTSLQNHLRLGFGTPTALTSRSISTWSLMFWIVGTFVNLGFSTVKKVKVNYSITSFNLKPFLPKTLSFTCSTVSPISLVAVISYAPWSAMVMFSTINLLEYWSKFYNQTPKGTKLTCKFLFPHRQ